MNRGRDRSNCHVLLSGILSGLLLDYEAVLCLWW